MRQLSGEYFNPSASLYHYLHIATGNLNSYLQGEQVEVKKYFYVDASVL